MKLFTVCHCYCDLQRVFDRSSQPYCPLCGGHFIKNRFKCIKSAHYASNEKLSPQDSLLSLRAQQDRTWTALQLTTGYKQHRLELVEFATSIAEYFQFKLEVLGLSVVMMDRLFALNEKCLARSKLYASVCVLLASKLSEVDALVPFISRLRRHASLQYSEKDYKLAEVEVLGFFKMEYNFPTHIDFIGAYLTGGVVFSSQKYSVQQFGYIEESMVESAKMILRLPVLLQFRPQSIAQAILLHSRESHGMYAVEPLSLYGVVQGMKVQLRGIQTQLKERGLRKLDPNRPTKKKSYIGKGISIEQENSISTIQNRIV